jgi:hypothetical protein
MRLLSMLLLLSLAFPVTAQIYKYTDADGNTGYSNQPPDGVKAQPVELPPLNSVESQPPRNRNRQPKPATANNLTSRMRYWNSLHRPSPKPCAPTTAPSPSTYSSSPACKERICSRLWLDDQPYGQPGNVPILQLVNIDRGQHRLAVQVIDGDTVIQQSPTVTFTLQRMHKR